MTVHTRLIVLTVVVVQLSEKLIEVVLVGDPLVLRMQQILAHPDQTDFTFITICFKGVNSEQTSCQFFQPPWL